jgi:hypothetical protein
MPTQTTALRDQVMGIQTSKFLPKTIAVFWDVKPCRLIDKIIVSGHYPSYCFYLQHNVSEI